MFCVCGSPESIPTGQTPNKQTIIAVSLVMGMPQLTKHSGCGSWINSSFAETPFLESARVHKGLSLKPGSLGKVSQGKNLSTFFQNQVTMALGLIWEEEGRIRLLHCKWCSSYPFLCFLRKCSNGIAQKPANKKGYSQNCGYKMLTSS